MASPIIDADNIGVIYNKGKQNEVHSLRRVSLKIYPQEYIIIFGPSGCGKSTLLYSLSGLQSPSYGTVSVKGNDLAQMSSWEQSRFRLFEIGMIFQAFYLVSTLDVLDNVCLPRIFEGEDQKSYTKAGMQLLQRFSISEQADKYPSNLSGGQQQRVAISRSLINDPDVIIADEPVGNLDSESAKNVMGILKELNEVDKKTIILVTHNPEHLSLANRVLKMKDGEIIEEIINKKGEDNKVEKIVIDRSKVIDEDIQRMMEEMKKTPTELRMLMRTFRGLSEAQSNVLLVPFKAKQLNQHLLHELTDEQLDASNRYLKELLFGNINTKELKSKLDLDYKKGGAGWNKQRAESTAERVEQMLDCVHKLSKNSESAIAHVASYLNTLFDLGFKKNKKEKNNPEFFRFMSVLDMRVSNKVDRKGLTEWLDIPYKKGGVGLRKDVAAKVAREVEMLMLLKYS